MASIINADNGVVSGSAGLKTSADSTGVLALQTNGTTAVTVDTSQNATFNSTGSLTIPVGTTAQRPASPVNGMTRYNTTLDYIEWYNSTLSIWLPIYQSNGLIVDYLIVGGGGGGSGGTAGGGGGGGVIPAFSISLPTAATYSVVVGAGGNGSLTQSRGYVGNPSSFYSFTALGGGYGACNGTGVIAGGNGGSGGGGAYYSSNEPPGLGTAGQGYAGSVAPNNGGGGGGGAGGPFLSATRNGGAGFQSSISGSSQYYAGGGGGAGQGDAGTGGLGGGGAGNQDTATAGTVNTGGGGGGGWTFANGYGGAGGSGIVIIKYSGTVQKATGGTVTQVNGNTIHTFTASGNFVVS